MATKRLPDQMYLRECFDYDPETGVLTWRERPLHHFKRWEDQTRWNIRHANKEAGSINPIGYRAVSLASYPFLAHRIIYRLMTGTDATQIDHKDRNPANNKWDNLRPATPGENNRNGSGRSRWRNNWLKGVGKRTKSKGGRWFAVINLDYRRVYLGTFDTEEEAHAAYRIAAQELHGEFANVGHCQDGPI